MNGVIIVDKQKGKTSFDEIRDIRKKYNIKKVGHIGTLDPRIYSNTKIRKKDRYRR